MGVGERIKTMLMYILRCRQFGCDKKEHESKSNFCESEYDRPTKDNFNVVK